jgi:hypothetical protein
MFPITWRLFVIKGVEVLKRLIFILLMLPLERLRLGGIEDMHEVFTIHLDPLTLAILLVERFLKSFVVRLEKPSVMHYFDG